MATRVWSSAGSTDMNLAANYTGSGALLTTDDLVFDGTSVVSATTTASLSVKSITASAAYAANLTFSHNLTINNGNFSISNTGNLSMLGIVITVLLSNTITIANTGTRSTNATTTITLNGSAHTLDLANGGDTTIGRLLTKTAAQVITWVANTTYCLTISSFTAADLSDATWVSSVLGTRYLINYTATPVAVNMSFTDVMNFGNTITGTGTQSNCTGVFLTGGTLTPNVRWFDDISGVDTNPGTYARPKQYNTGVTSGNAGDDFRWKSNITFSAVGGTGNCTFTNKSATVNLPSGHGVATNDILLIPASNGIFTGGKYRVSVSGDTATIQGWLFEGTTGSYATQKGTPTAPGHTTANGAFGGASGTDYGTYLTKLSGGWDSETTQNGYTVHWISNTTNGHMSISTKSYIDVSGFVFVQGITTLGFLASNNCRAHDNYFVNCAGGAGVQACISIGGGQFQQNSQFAVYNNNFQNSVYAIHSFTSSQPASVHGLDVYNNYFGGSAAGSILVFGGYAKDVRVRNNTFTRIAAISAPMIAGGGGGGDSVVIEAQANTWDNSSAGAAGAIVGNTGNYLFRNFNWSGTRFYAASNNLRFIARMYNVNASGVHEKFICDMGLYTQQIANDASFELPSGYSDILVMFQNLYSTKRGNRAAAGVSSMPYCESICPPISLRGFPINAVGVKFRLYYNAPSNALTGNMLWLEVRKMSDSTFYKSGTGALTQRVDLNDWSNYIETDVLTTSAVDELRITPFAAFYDASNKLAVAKMQISNDNGATWTNMTQTWVDGEITWALALEGHTSNQVLKSAGGNYNDDNLITANVRSGTAFGLAQTGALSVSGALLPQTQIVGG